MSFFIEMKWPGEKLSQYQRDVHARLIAAGVPVITATSFEEARHFVATEFAACLWTYSPDEGAYNLSCGQTICFDFDFRNEGRGIYKFCPHCGRKIELVSEF